MARGRGRLSASVICVVALGCPTTLGQSTPAAPPAPSATTGSIAPPAAAPGQAQTGQTTSAQAPGISPKATVPTFDLEKSLETARNTVRLFKDRLKQELSIAIKTDGAANAVPLCQTISPDISTGLTDESGFEVSRRSFKLRNPENAADAWETEVLRKFEAQVAAGADPGKLEFSAVVTTPEGDRLLRYMQGIPVGDMCLACHGAEIKPDVKAELTRYYPDDKATGYAAGDLRGAFSLVKLIGE